MKPGKTFTIAGNVSIRDRVNGTVTLEEKP